MLTHWLHSGVALGQGSSMLRRHPNADCTGLSGCHSHVPLHCSAVHISCLTKPRVKTQVWALGIQATCCGKPEEGFMLSTVFTSCFAARAVSV